MDEPHECVAEGRRLFCRCGKLVDRKALKSLRFQGFIGTASTSPKMEEFWQTGDPAVFDSPAP